MTRRQLFAFVLGAVTGAVVGRRVTRPRTFLFADVARFSLGEIVLSLEQQRRIAEYESGLPEIRIDLRGSRWA